MPESTYISVNNMKSGQIGKVIEIQGGPGLASRLSAMGLRPGQKIIKISSMFWRGPVTIEAGTTRIAIGYGMANKILVEPE